MALDVTFYVYKFILGKNQCFVTPLDYLEDLLIKLSPRKYVSTSINKIFLLGAKKDAEKCFAIE